MEPLFESYPELASAVDCLCALPPWQLTGASALVLSQGNLVLEVAKPKHWRRRDDGVTVVGLGAVGGSLEPGETLLAGLRREAREELGVALEMLSAEETVIVYEGERVERVALPQRGHPLPVLMTVSENLYRPELGPGARTLAIATFWACSLGELRLGDLYGVLRLPLGQLASVLSALPLMAEQVQSLPGVSLVCRAPLPARALLAPIWTVHSAWRALRVGPLPSIVES